MTAKITPADITVPEIEAAWSAGNRRQDRIRFVFNRITEPYNRAERALDRASLAASARGVAWAQDKTIRGAHKFTMAEKVRTDAAVEELTKVRDMLNDLLAKYN